MKMGRWWILLVLRLVYESLGAVRQLRWNPRWKNRLSRHMMSIVQAAFSACGGVVHAEEYEHTYHKGYDWASSLNLEERSDPLFFKTQL